MCKLFQYRLDSQGWLLALTGAYCVIAVMMNYLCMKPLTFGTSFVWMDGGLVVSWMVFLISNVITEVYGKKVAVRVAAIAGVVAFFTSLVAMLEVFLPTLPEYHDQSVHFAHIFGNAPRTIVSSALAFFLGNLVNVEIIDVMKRRVAGRDNGGRFFSRAVFSTIIGQLVDNGVFQVVAFAPVGLSIYEMRWVDIFTAVGMSTVFEASVEALFVPVLTIPLTKYLKKKL